MGQLISSQGGKHSRDDLNISTPVVGLPRKVELDNSLSHLPNLRVDLENGDFDLTQWEPQQLITTYHPDGLLGSGRLRGRGKILFFSHDTGKPRTNTSSHVIRTIKEKNEEQSVSSNERHFLWDDVNRTQSPIRLTYVQDDEKDGTLDSVAQNLSTRSRSQHNRKALTKDAHRLLRSASLDDLAQISSYLKTHQTPVMLGCKHFLRASKSSRLTIF